MDQICLFLFAFLNIESMSACMARVEESVLDEDSEMDGGMEEVPGISDPG